MWNLNKYEQKKIIADQKKYFEVTFARLSIQLPLALSLFFPFDLSFHFDVQVFSLNSILFFLFRL